VEEAVAATNAAYATLIAVELIFADIIVEIVANQARILTKTMTT
jgi:hypothetical protein